MIVSYKKGIASVEKNPDESKERQMQIICMEQGPCSFKDNECQIPLYFYTCAQQITHLEMWKESFFTYRTNSSCCIVNWQSPNIQHPHNIQNISFLWASGPICSSVNWQDPFLFASEYFYLEKDRRATHYYY